MLQSTTVCVPRYGQRLLDGARKTIRHYIFKVSLPQPRGYIKHNNHNPWHHPLLTNNRTTMQGHIRHMEINGLDI